MAEELIGGRYRLEERLGAGAMSEVWAAADEELERRVAIKVLARDADPERFAREARAAAALSHPNICGLYDYGATDDGRPYMVLECLEGGTLDDRLAAGAPLPDDETQAVAADVAAGLAHAHRHGVVHRDLKPGNILLDGEGRAKIADLGIARMSGAGTLTAAGTVLGTAAYISPEQARGEPATPASDVYSFGVILYRMLTGRLPFEAADPIALVRMHAHELPPPVSELRPDAPPRLESVAAAALAKDPGERPADGTALLAELVPGAGAATVLAPPPPLADTERTIVAPAATAPRATPGGPQRAFGRSLRAAVIVAAALLLATTGVAAAFIATGSSGDDDSGSLPAPSVSIPKRPTTTEQEATVAEEEPATTAPTTTEPTTSEETTTKKTTTERTTTRKQAVPPPPTTDTVETLPTESEPIEPPPPPPPSTETTTTVAAQAQPPPAATTTVEG